MSDVLYKLLPPKELKLISKHIPTGHTPLWKYWTEFVDDFLDEGGSTHTVSGIRTLLRYLLRNTDIATIESCNNPRRISKLLKEMKNDRHFKNTTRNKYKNVLNTYFRWLEDMEYIDENKVRKVRKSKEESVEVYALTSKQIDEMFMHIYESKQIPFVKRRNILFFDLLRATGARRCELLALKPSDITYHPKTRKHAAYWTMRIHRAKQKGSIDHLALPDWAAESFRNYMEIRNKTRANEELLFVSQSNKGTGLTDKGVTYFLNQLEEDMGYKVTSRAFRTHVATRLMEEGMSIQDISFYLGHKRISTTLRYIRKTHLMHRRCSDVMKNQINEKTLLTKNFVPGMIQ